MGRKGYNCGGCSLLGDAEAQFGGQRGAEFASTTAAPLQHYTLYWLVQPAGTIIIIISLRVSLSRIEKPG
jgi:hypothetical protein